VTALYRIDAKLSAGLWAAGVLFVLALAMQALLWREIGRIEAHVAMLGAQVAEIAQAVRR
jgi:hypothetical protein